MRLLQWLGLESKPEVLAQIEHMVVQDARAVAIMQETRALLGLPPARGHDSYALNVAEILHALAKVEGQNEG